MSSLLGTLRFLNYQRSIDRCGQDVGFDVRSTKQANSELKKKDDFEPKSNKKSVRGGSTPMVTPTFCMRSPVLPEIFSTEAIGLQSLLPEAEVQRASVQLSLRTLTEMDPKKMKTEDLGSLFQHMTRKCDEETRKRERSEPLDSTFEKKLKTVSSKSLMLPQDTPPLTAKGKPTVPGITPMNEEKSNGSQNNNSACGSSCHQCKSRRAMHKLYFCSNQGSAKKPKDKRHLCRKKYCDQCLEKFYQEEPPSHAEIAKWMCPACRCLCCCAACRRQKAKLADDPQTMSPATSLACGLVFGDMLDGKDSLNLEEAVNRGIQKQISLQKKSLQEAEKKKGKSCKDGIQQTGPKSSKASKTLKAQKKQKQESKKPKQAKQHKNSKNTKLTAKNSKTGKSKNSKQPRSQKPPKQSRNPKTKRKASTPPPVKEENKMVPTEEKASTKHTPHEQDPQGPPMKIAKAEVATATAAAAAAAAAVAQHNSHWFIQHHQVQLLAKLKQHQEMMLAQASAERA